jgi:phosphomevalonate kinase|tara:strand:+ start:523 stop:825 length:303 start_codon:yes stop_codon:yes gene_type:complete
MVNGKKVTLTSEEENKYNARVKEWEDTKSQRQLKQIKQERLQRLIETDYLAMSDNTMSEEIKAFRKSMRDIPQDYSEADYDDLLAKDEQGKLTHSVWSKP